MRYQGTMIGIFLIAMGALMFAWYLLLPAPQKQKLIEEIWNETEQSVKTTSNKITIENLILSKNGYEVLIASNYTIGKDEKVDEIDFGNFLLKSNVFSGPSEASFKFYLNKTYNKAKLTFYTDCVDCKIKVSLNGVKIYEGEVRNKTFELFLSKNLLRNENSLVITLLSPTNPFVEKTLEVYHLKITFFEKSKIIKTIYIPTGSKTYLVYDFCPTDPFKVKIKINNENVYVYSCSNYVLGKKGEDISNYIKDNVLLLEVFSESPVLVKKLSIVTEAKSFVEPFDFKASRLLIYVDEGEGTIKINNCKFNVNTNSPNTIYIDRCTEDEGNLLAIETNNYLKIKYLEVS